MQLTAPCIDKMGENQYLAILYTLFPNPNIISFSRDKSLHFMEPMVKMAIPATSTMGGGGGSHSIKLILWASQ